MTRYARTDHGWNERARRAWSTSAIAGVCAAAVLTPFDYAPAWPPNVGTVEAALLIGITTCALCFPILLFLDPIGGAEVCPRSQLAFIGVYGSAAIGAVLTRTLPGAIIGSVGGGMLCLFLVAREVRRLIELARAARPPHDLR
ncbi:MAG: hypothetical protein KGJ62_15515 [Armatimonadetes bacterium]|nr:hypothetical protein [Armatimonadota bacterium]MDE2206990.1 hypothetical protein [Armatimonadota bacterium]